MILNNATLEQEVNLVLNLTGQSKEEFYEEIVNRAIETFRDAEGKITATKGCYINNNLNTPCIIIETTTMLGQSYVRIYDTLNKQIKKIPVEHLINLERGDSNEE